MKKLIWIFIFWACSASVFATTFYIDSVTGSDSNTSAQAQSQATPWAHMPGMNGCTSNCNAYSVQAGDVFVLKGGSKWTFDSTTANLITVPKSGITIEGGQTLGTPWGTTFPVLDGSGSTADRSGIYLLSKNSITINGIKIINVANVNFSGHTGDGGGKGINLGYTGSNITISNNYLDNVGESAISVVAQASGGAVSHYLIHDNVMTNCGRLFVSIPATAQLDDIEIYSNTFLGTGTWERHTYHGDGIMIGSACATENGNCLTNTTIHHNKFLGDWSGGSTAYVYLNNDGCSSGWCNGGNGVYIYDNQMAADFRGPPGPGGGEGIYVGWGWTNVHILNNTIANNAPSSTYAYQSCIGLAELYSDTVVEIKNNILSGCQIGINMASWDNTNVTASNNLYQLSFPVHYIWDKNGTYDTRATVQAAGYETNVNASTLIGADLAHQVDPLFSVLPDGTAWHGNWHVQAGSPVIGAGTSEATAFTTDLDGNAWGVGWGVGAYKYTGADTTPPTVTAFTIPATSSSLTVSITTFTATDDTGVTGYIITESSYPSPPTDAVGWTANAPGSYTFASAGVKTLYAWAKDAAGNVSASRSASVTVTLVDVTPPTVTAFTIPSASALTIPILSFTATDDTGVTGYIITRSATTPDLGSAGWSAVAQSTYAVTSSGTYTLYAWARDAAGNVSASRNASVTVTDPAGKASQLSFRGITPTRLTAPTLTSPSNGATGVAHDASFSWSAVTGNSGYQVCVGTQPWPYTHCTTTAANVVTVAISTALGSEPAQSTLYYWWVRALGNRSTNSDSLWPTYRTFTSNSEYYLANAGSDSASGATGHPWQTISKVNSSSFSPGDHILFKGGQSWSANLQITSSGTSALPITISMYGGGAWPIIVGDAVLSTNYITVGQIEFVGTLTLSGSNILAYPILLQVSL